MSTPIEYVEALKWPGAFVFLGGISLVWIGPALARLVTGFNRIDIKKTGLTVSGSNQIEGAQKIESSRFTSKETYLQNPLVIERANKIFADLEALEATDQKEREDLLVKTLASVQIALGFERVYFWAYGSQLLALQALAGTVGGAQNKEIISGLYEQGAQLGLDLDKTSFADWIGFLKLAEFVEISDDTVSITLLGREFLKYLIDQGHGLVKGQ